MGNYLGKGITNQKKMPFLCVKYLNIYSNKETDIRLESSLHKGV